MHEKTLNTVYETLKQLCIGEGFGHSYSNSMIADRCGYKLSTVERAIEKLEEMGVIISYGESAALDPELFNYD